MFLLQSILELPIIIVNVLNRRFCSKLLLLVSEHFLSLPLSYPSSHSLRYYKPIIYIQFVYIVYSYNIDYIHLLAIIYTCLHHFWDIHNSVSVSLSRLYKDFLSVSFFCIFRLLNRYLDIIKSINLLIIQ